MKIAVILGGVSEERDVSIASGIEVIDALRSKGHEVLAYDTAVGLLSAQDENHLRQIGISGAPPSGQTLAELKRQSNSALRNLFTLQDIDVAFIALHGGAGENGRLQALLELAGIRYTGSDCTGSAIAMDKDLSKHLMQCAGVPTAAWYIHHDMDARCQHTLDYPLIVKPNSQGSSVGLSLVKHEDELADAIQLAGRFGDEVMLEQFISGREFTVGILNGRALSVGEIIVSSELFDYESKYQSGGADEIFPADLSEEKTREIQQLALKAHKALKLGAYSRIDFCMDSDGALYCLEANTVPGMTKASLLPQSAQQSGIRFPELCEAICHAVID